MTTVDLGRRQPPAPQAVRVQRIEGEGKRERIVEYPVTTLYAGTRDGIDYWVPIWNQWIEPSDRFVWDSKPRNAVLIGAAA